MYLEDEILSNSERQVWVEDHRWVHRAEGWLLAAKVLRCRNKNEMAGYLEQTLPISKFCTGPGLHPRKRKETFFFLLSCTQYTLRSQQSSSNITLVDVVVYHYF